MPKLNSFVDDMLDRNCQLSFLTEIWTKSENKSHQFKIEELYEMKGLKYISTPRPGARRGGVSRGADVGGLLSEPTIPATT